MRRSKAGAFWLAVGLFALAPGVAAEDGAACLESVAEAGSDEAAVLDPGRDKEDRQAALKRIVARALDGEHGIGAYLLGALYRLGEAHPAALVERDSETARHWYGRCIASAGCPNEVFASLAELELAEGRTHEALVYTHVYLNLKRLAETGDPSFYDVMLLDRVLARHGRVDEARLQAGIDAYVEKHGRDLQRILDWTQQPYGVTCDGALVFGYDYGGRKPKPPGRRNSRPGTTAWYLVPVAAEPAYPEQALLFEALPDAKQASGLERIVRTLRMKANLAPPLGKRWWFVVPIGVGGDGVKPVLIEKKPPAGRERPDPGTVESAADE